METSISYNEPSKSIILVNENKRRIEQYFSREDALKRKKDLLNAIIRKRDVKELFRIISVKLNSKKYVENKGNTKYRNLICEGEINIAANSRIAVYTCLVGDCDTVKEPLYCNPNIDYYIFTDQSISEESKWRKVNITEYDDYSKYTPVEMNRKIKMLGHYYLSEYDYTLYVDSTIQIVGDVYPLICNMRDAFIGVHTHASRDCIYMEAEAVSFVGKADPNKTKEQISRYRSEGFPEHFGLFQNSIMIKNQTLVDGNRLMEAWWDEYEKDKTRDQLSLPYIIWKTQIPANLIKILGTDASKNVRFFVRGREGYMK